MLVSAARVISAMITVLYTFLVAGSCSVPPRAPADAAQPGIPQEPPARTLTILQSRGEISGALQEAAEVYAQSRPGVQIRIQTIAGEASYQAALRSRLLSGERADLFHIFGYSEMRELEGHLEDISGISWIETAVEGILDPVRGAGGAVFGVPYSIEGVGLIANREIFEAAGISLEGVVTFEDMEEAFKALREKIALGELSEDFPALKAVTELPGQDTAFLGNQLADIALGGEFSSAAQTAQANGIAFANEKAMGKYVDLLARYATNGKGWQGLAEVPQTAQVENGLASGRVAVIQQNAEVYKNILLVNPELAGKLQLLPIPLEGAEHGYIYVSAPAFWAVNSASSDESKAIAADFLTWLYQSGEGAEIVAGRFEAVSAYRQTAADTGVLLHRRMLRLIEQGLSLPRHYREYPGEWSAQSFAVALRAYFSEWEYSWEDVSAKIKSDWVTMRRRPY